MNRRGPTPEVLARARARQNARWQIAEGAADQVSDQFKEEGRFHGIVIMPQLNDAFIAGIFYRTEQDKVLASANGLNERIVDAVHDALGQRSPGGGDRISVAFEFDSDENVQRKFGGNYWRRFR